MHDLITSLLMETNWLSFFMVEDMLLEKNEDLFENAGYPEERKF
jgi:hypothetical protein